MQTTADLWAVAFDDAAQTEQARARIAELSGRDCLTILDTARAARHADGTITLDGEPLVIGPSVQESAWVRILAGLIFSAPPLTGCALGQMLRTAEMQGAAHAGLDDDFVRYVAKAIKPGTFVLFVLDEIGDMDEILRGIQGLGGSVLRTNVDLHRAKEIQTALKGE
jgi:uncharacterized membrane protein